MSGFGRKSEKDIKQLLDEELKEQKENHLKWYNYLVGLLFILVGTVFIVYVQIDIPFICTFVACIFAIAGIISIISYCIRDVAAGYYRLDLVYGVIAAFAALLFYTKQDVIGVYFPVIAGFILFANGVVKLQHSIDMKRIDRKMKKVTELWLVVMIFALICIAAGFIAVYMTPDNNRTMFIFNGIAFIVAGASDIFTHIVFNRKVKLFRSGAIITEEKEEPPVSPTAEEPVETEPVENNKKDTADEVYVAEDSKEDPTEDPTEESTEDKETVNDATDPQA